MDILVFTDRLCYEMKKLGIPHEKAVTYINNLKRHLSPEDVVNATDDDIIKYAKICTGYLLYGASASALQDDAPTSDIPTSSSENPGRTPSADEISRLVDDSVSTDTFPSEDDQNTHIYKGFNKNVDSINVNDAHNEEEELPEPIPQSDVYDYGEKTTPRGILMLSLITLISSPLWLVAAAIFLAPFLIMFISEFAVTAALICVLAGGAAAGTAASLTGVVYGVVQIFSTPAIGLYEIGFGIIIGGVTMLCGILIYNGAVRFMPWLIKKTGRLYKFTFGKIKPLLIEYKRRCTRL